MAKLTVKNVGPIREAEFEVKKHTVFIGPQGSGKSTLAKLIAICSDIDLLPNVLPNQYELLHKYNLTDYTNKSLNDNEISFTTNNYHVSYTNSSFNFFPSYEKAKFITHLAEKLKLSISNYNLYRNHMALSLQKANFADRLTSIDSVTNEFYKNILTQSVLQFQTVYIPAERTLITTLGETFWSILYAGAILPKSIITFGRDFLYARNNAQKFDIPFLKVRYEHDPDNDKVFYSELDSVNLSQSASGYQSVIPLLLVVEHQRQKSHRRFIIEEPELNLYPTAQKDLIYSLMSGLDPNIAYQDAEWVITTHSPYVLSSFNTLMLAYKVAQKSDELRAEVEKIIPARCWINPDEFAAYYVDNGTVRNIISESTGLIADNELDDVSEDLAGEQDQLSELSRSVPRA